MPSKYKFHNQNGLYFIAITVVEWIDVFTRKTYKDIIVDSMNYVIDKKGLIIFAWVIMSNHLHMIVSCEENYHISDAIRDFKKYTSKRIISEIHQSKESRRRWMLAIFESHGIKNPNNTTFQFWQQDNHPVELDNNSMIDQRVDYIHNNPVKAGIVNKPEDYVYSSARDYCDEIGLVKIRKV